MTPTPPARGAFCEKQPKDGDVILHCGHLDVVPHHAYLSNEALTFMRPDGTTGKSYWQICCHQCYLRKETTGEEFQIRGDGIWKGNAPEFREVDHA